MANILHLFLTSILIFSNLGLNSQIQGQSPWFQWSLTSAGTVPLRLGGTNVVTDESGAQVEYVEYAPFGSVKQDEGRKNISRKFTGKELDSSTGLYDYDARQYDAKLGRFISADTVDPDWANPQSLNRYSYTLNNPLKYVDPSGNVPLDYMTDPFFLAMSWAEFEANPNFWSGAALGVDAILTAIPYVPAFGGGIIRGVSNALTKADVGRATKVVDKAGDVGKARGVPKTGHRYVGPKEAREIKDTGVIPNVDEYKNPKTVFYTPDKQLKSSKAAKGKYNLGEKPTHRVDLDISKTKADYGGNVAEGKGIEMTTREKIPVKKVERLKP